MEASAMTATSRKTPRMSLTIAADVADWVTREADNKGVSVSEHVSRLLYLIMEQAAGVFSAR